MRAPWGGGSHLNGSGEETLSYPKFSGRLGEVAEAFSLGKCMVGAKSKPNISEHLGSHDSTKAEMFGK